MPVQALGRRLPNHMPGSARRLRLLLPALLPPGDAATASLTLGKGKWCQNQSVSPLLPCNPCPQGQLLGALPAAGPARVSPGSARPGAAGAGRQSLLDAGSRAGRRTLPPAPTGSGVCSAGLCLALGIAPALRERAVSPVWFARRPWGWRDASAGGQEGGTFPQPHCWPPGQDPGAGPPRSGCRTPQHWAGGGAGGKPKAWRLTGVARAGRGAAGLPVRGAVPGSVPGPCAPQAGAVAAPRAPHALPELPCVLVHLPLCSSGCYATAGSRCLAL